MNDIDQLLDAGIRGSDMKVRSVLVSRKAEVVDIEETPSGVIVIARTSRGGRLEQLGSSAWDAMQRLAYGMTLS